jgi:hypothetical protein
MLRLDVTGEQGWTGKPKHRINSQARHSRPLTRPKVELRTKLSPVIEARFEMPNEIGELTELKILHPFAPSWGPIPSYFGVRLPL